jgi:hypothetical protein
MASPFRPLDETGERLEREIAFPDEQVPVDGRSIARREAAARLA